LNCSQQYQYLNNTIPNYKLIDAKMYKSSIMFLFYRTTTLIYKYQVGVGFVYHSRIGLKHYEGNSNQLRPFDFS